MTRNQDSDDPPAGPTSEPFGAQVRALEALRRRGRLRSLSGRAGHDFASNDYLGLANATELRDAVAAALARGAAIGSGGSRLLRGNDPEHEALEQEAARWFGTESALFFAGGFSANAALFSTLPQRSDLVVHDELIHASVHEGIRGTKAEAKAARHNDAQSVDDAIRNWRTRGGTGRPWIAVESLYSMDGDTAPLEDLAAIADARDGVLVVDEAHATGCLGDGGRGLAADLEGRANVITLHTCGKALGTMGGLICGPRTAIDFLVNRSRAFIYATAPSPLIAASVRASLRLVEQDPGRGPDSRRARLAALVTETGRLLTTRCGLTPTRTHIQPIILGPDRAALELSEKLQAAGFDVRPIRPPTVPEGTARLRLSLTLNVTPAVVEQLVETLAAEGVKDGALRP